MMTMLLMSGTGRADGSLPDDESWQMIDQNGDMDFMSPLIDEVNHLQYQAGFQTGVSMPCKYLLFFPNLARRDRIGCWSHLQIRLYDALGIHQLDEQRI